MLFVTDMKVVCNCYHLFINPYKFVSSYLYFFNNLKDIKDHIINYIIPSKMLFSERKATVFKEKNELIATPFIYFGVC